MARVWDPFAWASLIIYAQVYVGVHYPLDVLGGAAWGIMLGSLTGKAFNSNFHLQTHEAEPSV
jgi:undecaprenyl-diphosphatase